MPIGDEALRAGSGWARPAGRDRLAEMIERRRSGTFGSALYVRASMTHWIGGSSLNFILDPVMAIHLDYLL